MNTKEYVSKHSLDRVDINNVKDRKDFYADLLLDFCSMCDLQVLRSGKMTIELFDKTVDKIEDKFDSISNRCKVLLSDDVWYGFYDDYIVPTKYVYMPEVREKEDRIYGMTHEELAEYLAPVFSGIRYAWNARKLRDRYSREYEGAGYYLRLAFDRYVESSIRKERKEKEREKREQEQYWEQYRRNMFNAYWSLFRVQSRPVDEYKVLELSLDATEEDVKRQYRKMSMVHHPDKGGSHETFIAITEAKNKITAYMESIKNS